MSAHWITENAAEIIQNLREDQVCAANSIFNTQTWIKASLRHLLAPRSPIVLKLETEQSQQHHIVFSFGRETLGGIPLRTLRLVGHPYTDRVVLGDHPEIIENLTRAIATLPLKWDIVILDEIVASDVPAITESLKSQTPQYWTRARHCAHTPLLRLQSLPDSDLDTAYSKSLRTRLRRSRKKLANRGDSRFERLRVTPNQVDEVLAVISPIEDSSWKGSKGVGIFKSSTRKFFQEVSYGLSELGYLDVSLLFLDEQPIAYRYGFRFQDSYYDYNFAHLPGFNDLSPGRILLDDIVQSSAREGLAAIDGSRGSLDRPQLLSDWTDEYIDHYVLWIGNKTLPGRMANLAANSIQPLIAKIRSKSGEQEKT